jgi:5-methylcytosine-specific restriction endonuclease McrA
VARKKARTEAEREHILAEGRREQERRLKSYREQALRMFPWVCAHCGREFSGKRLRELTVHHKDHDHDNNPLDGSNWELLCIYCHDNEHSRRLVADEYDGDAAPGATGETASTYQPFSGLADLLKNKK